MNYLKGMALALGLTLSTLTLAASVTDLAGRQVTLPAKVGRIILGEGRMLTTLAILEKQQLPQRVVGMLGDFEQLDPAGYAQYRQRFPALDKVVRLGKTSAATFSAEQAIALKPDLAIFSLSGHGPDVNDHATLKRLQAAGITVLYVDFTRDPLLHTVRSVEVLGQALGRQQEAAEFIAFYQAEMDKVRQRLQRTRRQPTVFLESRVGLSRECCETMTHGMIGRLLDAAGGHNIAGKLVPGMHGTVNLEFLLKAQPEVYIGTAIGNPASVARGVPSIALGSGIDAATARASLRKVLTRPGFPQLKAVAGKRAFAIWHHYNYSAQNIIGLQAMAKWLYPQEMADLQPEDTLRRFYQRFQPVALNGTYWTQL